MFTQRNRFLSDQFPNRLPHLHENSALLSPKIPKLELDPNVDLEDLVILPSEEFEDQKTELLSYLSSTDDDYKESRLQSKFLKDRQFSLIIGKRNVMKRRAYSTALTDSKIFIYDALVFYKR